MAIAFARARYLSRSTGGNACRSASYNAREAITDLRTGERYSFAHRDAPEHHAVLLPEDADATALGTSAQLWNVAEGAERRRDAQVAREIVLALPADKELTHDDRVELARSFAREHFVSRGLAVQLDVHAPHDAERGGGEDGSGVNERANHHAHLLITTRRVEGGRLSARKARDLDPEVRSFKGGVAVTDGERWGALWAAHQDAYFAEHGLKVRVEATAAVPGKHIGPIRMRSEGSAAVARAEEIARENAAAARDPETVLRVLTRGNATFTMRELDRHLAKHIFDEGEHLDVKARVLGQDEVLALYDPATGRASGRYTTREVRAQERAALDDGARLAEGRAGTRHRALRASAVEAACAGRTLRADQRAALDHAAGAGGLKILEGRAGTGKSYTLAAVRAAHVRAGYEVVGLGPTNGVAQDLKADGFDRVATAHSELFRLRNGRVQWTHRTLVVVDEAAMCDARITGELLAEARRSGAKLVLAGDDRQLASIERGGLFAELIRRHGSVEITQVTRQRVDWQRRAARDLAQGHVAAAVKAFDDHGALDWSATEAEARARLVARWTADTATDTEATRFVFAYTNVEVDALNAELRAVRRARGELGADVAFETKHGKAAFAVGDRIQVTDTDRRLGLSNGAAGVITAIDEGVGRISVRLDAGAAGEGRVVTWLASEFEGFRHGYAGTIYKGQGKTLDHTYLLHSRHWRRAASYVALTRQRQSATIFAASETARDLGQLARQMARGEVRAASLAWATRDELSPELLAAAEKRATRRATARRGATQRPGAVPEAAPPASTSTPERTSERAGQGASPAEPGARPARPGPERRPARPGPEVPSRSLKDHGWLIAPAEPAPPLGRGDIAAAVAASPEVQRERAALGLYLEGTYRNPGLARARLEELVTSHGPTSAARRIAADPGQLGALRGRTGLLAGPAARRAHAEAMRVGQAIAPAVTRIGAAEAKAATEVIARDAAARAAAQTGVPRLSEAARAAIGGLGADSGEGLDTAGRAKAWAALCGDARVAGEVDRFLAAAEARFGVEGLRAFERGSVPEGSKGPPAERAALADVGRAVTALRRAERAAAGQAQRLAAGQRAGQGARPKP
jgi:Ti-type conjugative transfer relaxase TraA